ncbi:hypothetical protein [Nonomuraea sp. NPDC050643]|uniref:hypothetical protein n=1 Tax=Nonomuraea sp. NPDC050643 TaxID=3155660 RepID=UPI0033E92EB9
MSRAVVNGVVLEGDVDGITIVKGYFGRKKKRCIKGFGICKVRGFPPSIEDDLGPLERQIAEPHEDFYAAFLLDPEEAVMEIRFLEPIPHFETDFFVDEGYAGVERLLRDLCGYQQILPTLGQYRAHHEPDAPHGVVTLDVLLGRRK